MSDQVESAAGFYRRLVGETWAELAEPVRQFHTFAGQFRGKGKFTVRHGTGFLARTLVWLMRLPPEGKDVPVRLIVDADESGERWDRSFAGRPFITRQGERVGGLMTERVGLNEVWYRLKVENGALCYVQEKASLRLGPLRLPLPRAFAPNISAREGAAEDGRGVNVSVKVFMPLAGLLIHYEGKIVSEDESFE